ncbi:Uncharacterized protein FKW44_025256 [Caligus rogercresseyi]|uniref:Uncharacterized protein n=1 Tax=Caligus rogercresseyi TaxID=217165 RepID=A0A7T8JTL3_CALRO|nr:Uncharacterized protein FKW44_025256 [Caligus rogercresseyi]
MHKEGSITQLVLQGDLLQAQSYRPTKQQRYAVSFQVRASRSGPQVSQESTKLSTGELLK